MKKALRGIVVLLSALVGVLSAQAQMSTTVPTVTPDFVGPPAPPTAACVFNPSVVPGWNLLVNSCNFPLAVAETFGTKEQPLDSGVTGAVKTVWKRNAATSNWLLYSTELDATENANYVFGQQLEQKPIEGVIAQIDPGEGFWVNAKSWTSLPRRTGEAFTRTPEKFAAMPIGWNLTGATEVISPRQLNIAVNATPMPPYKIPTWNFKSLWKWDTGAQTWRFYAPSLEAQGWQAVQNYTNSKGYGDATYDEMQPNGQDGFWILKLPAPILVPGCMDPYADNYNPLANELGVTCVYSGRG